MKPALASLAVTATLTLAGCGTHATPAPAPAASVASSVSPTEAGPVEPTPPPHAYDDTKAGVIAFAKYYWRVVDYALASGDTSTLRTLEHDCAACAAGRRWIDQVYRRGGSISGGAHHVVHAAAPFFNPNGAGLTLTINTSPQVISGAGDLDARTHRTHDWVAMAVNAVGSLWRVSDVDIR